ncbi:MAG: TonB-dependent receptor [Saprospiraceae bacterium]|nr:TonB-dependent receptor [Saprospiraceae bacterium]
MNKLLQRLVMLAVFWVMGMGFVEAQRTVTGTVTDQAGEPMIGVNIQVLGTTVGTVSDFDGGYTLQVPAGATQLQFSYTGYDAVIKGLGTANRLDAIMAEGAVLEDVVITGYGTVKRENVTGSIATVKSEDFNKGSITSPQELLAGKVAGVNVTTNGEPGGGAVIRIRGGSSLSAINDPLIIIDGVPVASNPISGSRNNLNIVNPNDIETFTVLKDASATAIYGSRASNGVIIITTKRGTLGSKLGVSYNGSAGVSKIAKRADNLNAGEFRGLVNSRFEEGHPARSLMGSADTDWQDQIYQDGFYQDHSLSVNGGIGQMPYRVSLGYTDRDGLIKTDNFNRITGALNLNPRFLDNKLQMNLSGKYMIDKNHFAEQGAIGAAVAFDPTQPVYSGNSNYGGYYTWLNTDGTPSTLSPDNPLALLEQTDNNSEVNRYILGAEFDYRLFFLEDLRVNLNLGYDFSKGEGRKYIPTTAAFENTNGGRDENYSQENKNELLEVYLNYAKELDQDFAIDLMAGYSWQHFYFDNYFGVLSAEAEPDTLTDFDYDTREYYLLSVFGRANFTLWENLLVTATLRRDGSSRFSEDNRWGMFPGAAIAWKLTDNSAGDPLGLKVRLSWGITGQQDIGGNYYPYLASYQTGQSTAQYPFGGSFNTTLRPNGYDANIKWEETTTYNLGMDYSVLDNRLFGSIDFYLRETKDLINFVPVPAGTNLTNFLTTNVGDLENRGVELAINTVPWRKGNNEWTLGFNVALNENEITKLTATDDPNYQGVLTGGISGGVGNNVQIHSVGYPANSFFVFEQVYDAAGIPIEGLYVDRNGDGVVNPSDMYRYKKARPDATFGFYTGVNAGRFDVSAGARASLGNFVYNNNLANQAVYDFVYNSSGGAGGGYLNNVHGETQTLDINSPRYFSDHYVQDASFFRIDHVTAGYNFGNIGSAIESLRLYATVQNPLLVTRYDGIDPEVFSGIDNNVYPRSRTFLMGVNVNF